MRAPQDMPRRERRGRGSHRGRIALVVIAIALFVLITSLRAIASFYTDYLWFDSVDQTSVWRGVLGTKLSLALTFIGVFFGLCWLNLFIADRLAPAFRPGGPEEELIERYHDLVGRRAGLVRTVISLLFAVVAGIPATSQWNEWILFRNSQDFGVDDPQFHRDVGFYVFELPFLTWVVGWLFTALVIILIITAVAHYLNGGIRVQTPFQRVTPQVKAHLSVLLGALALIKATAYYFDQFELLVSTRGTVDGATYTDINVQLPAIRLLLLISIAAFVLFIVNIFRRGWVLPVLGVGLWAFVALIAGGVLPAIIQKFVVEPSESSKERTYVSRNIEYTRRALGLSEVTPTSFAAANDLTTADLVANTGTVENIRIWDPADQILGQTYASLQNQQPFYEISDVDVDRYMVDGELTQMMVSARELNTGGVPQSSWEARHLAYTHGYGLVASRANAKDEDGRPDLAVRDVPIADDAGLGISEPAIYFGENLGGYVIVRTKRQEIDYQGADGKTELRNYEGDDGIDIGSPIHKAAFALRFGDFNPLFSGNLTGESRIMLHRDIRDRVEALAPFLSFDADPYPVVIDGRILWVIDGYTTTDRYPYAQRAQKEGVVAPSSLPGRFNYVRNSVKATVDAYDGTVTFYVVDEGDPIIRAYRDAFPSLFSDTPPSDALRAHFRYPEDLFKVQTNMWGRYHIEDPDTFYNRSDAWVVARDPGIERARTPITTPGTQPQNDNQPNIPQGRISPYYLLLQLPGEEAPGFVLVRPFVPFSEDDSRQQLTAFMVARSDPGQYGQLQTYIMPTDQRPDGPGLVAGTMNSDATVAQQITLLGQQGSEVRLGNLITVPIEQSFLSVRPLYVVAQGNNLPLLRRIIVEYDQQVAIGDTLQEALRGLPRFNDLPVTDLEANQAPDVGGDVTPPGETPTTPPPAATVAELLAEAERLFEEANAALARNPPDFALYQQRITEARTNVARAIQLLNESGAAPPAEGSGGTGGSGDTTTTSVPEETTTTGASA